MKNFLATIMTVIAFFASSAQRNYLVNETKHELIMSIGNPITHIAKKSCGKFYLTTNNGKIERLGDGCQYLIYPERIGLAKILIHNKLGKVIEEKNYHVRDIRFEVYIPGIEKNIDNVEKLSNSIGLQLRSDDLVCWDIPVGIKYDLIIIENNKTPYIISDQDEFNDEIRTKFLALKSGEIIVFNNIKLTIGEKVFDVPEIVLNVI